MSIYLKILTNRLFFGPVDAGKAGVQFAACEKIGVCNLPYGNVSITIYFVLYCFI